MEERLEEDGDTPEPRTAGVRVRAGMMSVGVRVRVCVRVWWCLMGSLCWKGGHPIIRADVRVEASLGGLEGCRVPHWE